MGKPYPVYTHSFHTHRCHPDVAVFVALGKAIVISEIHVLNLTIHKHRKSQVLAHVLIASKELVFVLT